MPAYLTGEKRMPPGSSWSASLRRAHAKWTNIMPYQPKAVELDYARCALQAVQGSTGQFRHPIPLHPKLPEMADAIQVEGQKYLLDQQTAEETLQKLQAKLEELLK